MSITQTEHSFENPKYLFKEEPMFCKLLKNAFFCVKDAHREKAPSNETQALTKSINMGIWVVGTTNQLSIRGS